MDFLRNVSVLILGLGESGTACARFAQRLGAHVLAVDTRDNATGFAQLQTQAQQSDWLGSLSLRCAPFQVDLLQGISQLVVSPGLSPLREDVAAILMAAQAQGVRVLSELDWFNSALLALQANQAYQPVVLAITGTNGKTTVTELTTHLCKEAELSAIACGNISPCALDALMAAMDAAELPAVWVIELSSFQLHYTQQIRVDAAALLNITQDHLDWHGDMAAYASAKAKLFDVDTFGIMNRDDPQIAAMKGQLRSHSTLGFGLGMPACEGDFGIEQSGGMAWLAQAVNADPGRKLKKKELPELTIKKLMPADALRIRGGHNHCNALAALALAQAAGASMADCLHGLRSFEVAANRCELIAVINDVEYVNDSKGTNVGATVAALNGLGESRQRIVLLAGGDGKGQDFSPLAPAVSMQCKAVVLYGQDAALLSQSLKDTGVSLHRVDHLEEAVRLGASLANTGDVVLLSPACASLDQFKNYAHRAQVFKHEVQVIANEQGISL